VDAQAYLNERWRPRDPALASVELLLRPDEQRHNTSNIVDSSPKRRPMLVGLNCATGGAGGDAYRGRSIINTELGALSCNSPAADFKFLHDGTACTIEGVLYALSLGAVKTFLDTTNAASTANVGLWIGINGSGTLRVFMVAGSAGNPVTDVSSTGALVAGAHVPVRIEISSAQVVTARVGSTVSVHAKNGPSAPSAANPTNRLYFGSTGDGSIGFPGRMSQIRISRGTRTEPWPPRGLH
jgi:hypothetical protein